MGMVVRDGDGRGWILGLLVMIALSPPTEMISSFVF